MTVMRKMDWNKRLRANPLENQKKIRMMEDSRMIAHTSIEKAPNDFYRFISCSWDT